MCSRETCIRRANRRWPAYGRDNDPGGSAGVTPAATLYRDEAFGLTARATMQQDATFERSGSR